MRSERRSGLMNRLRLFIALSTQMEPVYSRFMAPRSRSGVSVSTSIIGKSEGLASPPSWPDWL